MAFRAIEACPALPATGWGVAASAALDPGDHYHGIVHRGLVSRRQCWGSEPRRTARFGREARLRQAEWVDSLWLVAVLELVRGSVAVAALDMAMGAVAEFRVGEPLGWDVRGKVVVQGESRNCRSRRPRLGVMTLLTDCIRCQDNLPPVGTKVR